MSTSRTIAKIGIALLVAGMLVNAVSGSAYALRELTDRRISMAVDDRLMDDTATPAWSIDVSTADGIVTLSGNVNNLLAKDRAEKIASTIKGVRGIVNRLEVESKFRSDREIEEDVQNALLRNPVTESWEMLATVNNNVVNLSGNVDSWQERELAATIAKGIRGVKGIDNDLTVDYDMERKDAEIAEEIKEVLRWNARVDDALINVSVDDGTVQLSGTVGSLAERTEAEREAWVAGVKSVDTAGLMVKWWARDDRLRSEKYTTKTDAQVEDAVKDAFLYDPRVNSFKIDVESDGGYVTLRGTVDNLKAKRSAAMDARNVVGVWRVDNRIKVRPNTPSDRTIKENVKDALIWDPYLEKYEIAVAVNDGEVSLYGDVDSTFERGRADNVAARQRGVRDVNNYLTVNDTDIVVYDPYVDDWDVEAYGWYTIHGDRYTDRTDLEIKRSIESELYWSPFVDSDEVNVEVNDGVAALTGTVDTWAEHNEATDQALQGGAVTVDNDLSVGSGPNAEYYRTE